MPGIATCVLPNARWRSPAYSFSSHRCLSASLYLRTFSAHRWHSVLQVRGVDTLLSTSGTRAQWVNTHILAPWWTHSVHDSLSGVPSGIRPNALGDILFTTAHVLGFPSSPLTCLLSPLIFLHSRLSFSC